MMKKVIILLLLGLTCLQSKAQNPQQLRISRINDVSVLPQGIVYQGKFKDGIRYSDNLGEHIVIITETGIYYNKNNEQGNQGNDAELFAYHFDINKDGSIKQTWRVYDFYKDCPVEIAANFIENAFQITDLDNDGIAEIWLVYIKGCHGDVSPWEMKIIMYEGLQKFAIRGEQKVEVGDYSYGGNYKFDNAFNNSPKVFRDFAIKLWNKNLIMKFE